MSRSAISERPGTAPTPTLDTSRQDVLVVAVEIPRPTDHQQQRRAFFRRCEEIAWQLATSSRDERIAAYSAGAFRYRELATAVALRPDLMPTLNGEWEWIAFNAE